MANPTKAEELPIMKVFRSHDDFRVPDYQRLYAWGGRAGDSAAGGFRAVASRRYRRTAYSQDRLCLCGRRPAKQLMSSTAKYGLTTSDRFSSPSFATSQRIVRSALNSRGS